jgi:hypothetical protein
MMSLDLTTGCLQGSCSANWATSAKESGQAHTRTAGSVGTAVKDTAPSITQSALLKNKDRGIKKALIGNTNQGLNALEGSKHFEPSSNVFWKATASRLHKSRPNESIGVETRYAHCAVRYRLKTQTSCRVGFS